MFVSIPLPQPLVECPLIVVTGELLRTRHEAPAVGRWLTADGEKVNVIGHETVRNQLELFVSGSSQDLRTREVDAIRRDEEWAAPTRTKCEEISMRAQVVEAAQRLRMERNHAPRNGNDCAIRGAE